MYIYKPKYYISRSRYINLSFMYLYLLLFLNKMEDWESRI